MENNREISGGIGGGFSQVIRTDPDTSLQRVENTDRLQFDKFVLYGKLNELDGVF
jgi:hypothetical protein